MPAPAFQKFHRGSSKLVKIEPSITVLNCGNLQRRRAAALGAVLIKSRLKFRIFWLMSMEHCRAEGCAGFSGRGPEPKSGHSIQWWWIVLHTFLGEVWIISFPLHGMDHLQEAHSSLLQTWWELCCSVWSRECEMCTWQARSGYGSYAKSVVLYPRPHAKLSGILHAHPQTYQIYPYFYMVVSCGFPK